MAGPAVLAGARDGRTRYRWRFWSSHKWPFFAGSVTLLKNNERYALRAFKRWLPFKVEVIEE